MNMRIRMNGHGYIFIGCRPRLVTEAVRAGGECPRASSVRGSGSGHHGGRDCGSRCQSFSVMVSFGCRKSYSLHSFEYLLFPKVSASLLRLSRLFFFFLFFSMAILVYLVGNDWNFLDLMERVYVIISM